MATFNGESFIAQQIDSILAQLNQSDELIISDDSSTDRTLEIIKSYNDSRIILSSENQFSSPTFNFENAIKSAKNEYIFLADQDDLWLPNKVLVMKEYLKSCDLVVCNCSIIDDAGQTLRDSYFELRKSGKGFFRNLSRNTYLGCCMAFNKAILKKALPFPKDIPMHDIWLGFIAELFYNPKFLNITLMQYRKHSNNASSASSGVSSYTLLQKIRFRYNLIKYIPSLILR